MNSKIYVIKHPETEWNKLKILQGHKNSDLTKVGKKTANAIGKRLKNKNITKIYSSDLGRCMQTSKIIAKIIKTNIIKSKRLRERNFGDLNGFQNKIIHKLLDLKNPKQKAPRGESFNQMSSRVLKFLKTLPKNKNILVVTHDGGAHAILSKIYKVKHTSKKCKTRRNHIIILDN